MVGRTVSGLLNINRLWSDDFERQDQGATRCRREGVAKLFISHSTGDDAIVGALQQALGELGQDVWIDSRELRGGDALWPEIQQAIEDAEAYAVVISPGGLQSEWLGDELRHALEVQKQRGKDSYPIVPLSLDGTKLGVLKQLFGESPLYIRISSAAGGVEAALNAILVALGKREPADVAETPQPRAEPLEELVLELGDLKIVQLQEGVRRASGRARLVYEPATPGQREVASEKSWRFVAPLGPLEADDLRWYLEKYAIWPSHVFRDRARKVEDNLVAWGRLLHDAAMPVGPTANVRNAWARIDGHAGRRFSIHVDATLEVGSSDADVVTAREAATLLLGLPWELLHDGDSFLFQGARPTRVRRRLPNTRDLDVAVVATPIRILDEHDVDRCSLAVAADDRHLTWPNRSCRELREPPELHTPFEELRQRPVARAVASSAKHERGPSVHVSGSQELLHVRGDVVVALGPPLHLDRTPAPRLRGGYDEVDFLVTDTVLRFPVDRPALGKR